MASGAIWFERREFPRDRLGICDVTAVATDGRAVIRIKWRHVPIRHRRPERSPVAGVAGQCCQEMPKRPAFGGRAVVAADARSAQAGVIDARARKGHCALVASLAGRIRDDVPCRLAGGDRTAMAPRTIRNEPRVVHAGSGERYRTLMARLARRIGDDMVWPLPGRRSAVVAGGATSDQAGVVRLWVEQAR